MATLKKIGSCSYCQARVVISVTAGSRHELVCTACGAPLEHTEVLAQVESRAPATREANRRLAERDDKPPRERDDKHRRERDENSKRDRHSDSRKSRERKSRKRKPRGLRYWFKKIIDEIEDLFD